MNKQHIEDYIVVKELRKSTATVFFNNKDKSDPYYCRDLYKEFEYTQTQIFYPNPDESASQKYLPISVSKSSLEDCIKYLNEISIPEELRNSKDKRRYEYDEHFDAKLLSVELIRVKTTIEETVEDSVSFEDELKEVAWSRF